jgi:hypothetical protein
MAKSEIIPELSKNARLRLYQLVGYPQPGKIDRADADLELQDHGLINLWTGEETAKAHRVAETLLFN